MNSNFWLNLKKPFSILAPMEDVTDLCFRKLIATYHRPDVFFTEFTSTDGLFSRGSKRVLPRLDFEESEHPIVAQIWGNNPELYVRAGQVLKEMKFDGIDINMGCPVTKVVRRGQCSGLIGNASLAQELIAALREGSGGLPISVKTRLGVKRPITESWFSFLLEQNLDALTVHGRIASELSKKPADWCEIKKVVEMRNSGSYRTLIIGNGDVTSREEFESRAAESGVDGVMVGRGIFNNFYIFDPSGRRFTDLPAAKKLQLLLKHFDLFEELHPVLSTDSISRRALGRYRPFKNLKKFFKIYAHEFRGASELRDTLVRVETMQEARQIVNQWLSEEIELCKNCL